MRDTVRCPSCKAILVVPPAPPAGDFSCPRCQSLVPLPRPAADSEANSAVTAAPLHPPGPTSIQPEPPGEPSDDLEKPASVWPRTGTIVLMSLIACCVLGIVGVVLTKQPGIDRIGGLVCFFAILDVSLLLHLGFWITN